MDNTEKFMKSMVGDDWTTFANKVMARVDAKLDAQSKALFFLCSTQVGSPSLIDRNEVIEALRESL